ncbi:MAG: hydantoinase/oxoprolinase family protein [Pseudomonadota bacterium]
MTDYRVGVDIGGTFTDIVFIAADGTVHVRKVSSSVDDYARAIVEGIATVFDEAGIAPSSVREVLHGTTVASNAILESKGARTGLITTRGFRDVLEIRNLRMPRLYDLHWEKPPPLVERYLRIEVKERINAAGAVQIPLLEADCEVAVQRLLREDVDAIAVCLLNSYANPVHERMVERTIQRLAPDHTYCISYDVLPEIKEYERTSTTVINAYVKPIVGRYLTRLQEELAASGIEAPLLLMQSNGGLTTARDAADLPCNIIESGPAGGVVGAQTLANKVGIPNIITFDMGGTTAKASLVEGGQVTRSLEYSVGGGIMIGSRLLTGAGYQLSVPAIDLAEVGAGGGSIVSIDAGGSMQIGPQSAGASPGPLCYDMGGTEPTVTDANLLLGYINPAYLVGGALRLNRQRSEEVFAQKIATPLGLDLAHAAYGAHQIAASNMIRAIRAVSSERGRDPRQYTMFAFGGNGPLFACSMASALQMSRVVVPPAPGLFSSFGLLYADVEHHVSRTLRRVLSEADPNEVNDVWSSLEAQARAQLSEDGFDADHMRFQRTANMHYKGQIFELSVSVPPGDIDEPALRNLAEAFGQEHERTYGHRAGVSEPVELVTMSVVGLGVPNAPRVPEALDLKRPSSERADERSAYFGLETGWLTTPVIGRADLVSSVSGPCIVEEYDATCLVPPKAEAVLDSDGNIVIDLHH